MEIAALRQRPAEGEDEFAVLAAVRPGERSAGIEQAYRAHYRDVYRFVLALSRSHDEAEEVTAETFERAIRSWDKTPSPVVPWLLLTARRIWLDRWRRARRWTRLIRQPDDRPAGAEADRTEFWVWFDAVSRALTARQREALVLRYQRDLTDADIGFVMGITESAVRSLVARALEVLRTRKELWP